MNGRANSTLPAVAIVEAIADAERVEPLDLNYKLEDYISVDAIEALAANGDGDWTLRFSVPDHTVTIDSDGWVKVDGVVMLSMGER